MGRTSRAGPKNLGILLEANAVRKRVRTQKASEASFEMTSFARLHSEGLRWLITIQYGTEI